MPLCNDGYLGIGNIRKSINRSIDKTTVRSTTLFGLSVVVVMFDDGVDNNFARIQINNALQGLADKKETAGAKEMADYVKSKMPSEKK